MASQTTRQVSICGLAFDWEVPEAWVVRALESVWRDRSMTSSSLPQADDQPFTIDVAVENDARTRALEHGNPGDVGRATRHRFGDDV